MSKAKGGQAANKGAESDGATCAHWQLLHVKGCKKISPPPTERFCRGFPDPSMKVGEGGVDVTDEGPH